jgi:hypothetical protein
MRNTIITGLISLLIFGCKKDKFSTTPQLKYKSVSTKVLFPDQIITFKLSYTDAEGDLEDSLYVEKVVPRCSSSNFTQKYPLPRFPTGKNAEGEIEVAYAHGINLLPDYPTIGAPICSTNDTCFLRFMLKDKAQNKSDTVNSEMIVIVKQ